MTGSGGSASVVGKNGAVDLASDTCSAVASVETSQNVFSKTNSCLFRAKERNGVLVIVFRCSPSLKLSSDWLKTLADCFGKSRKLWNRVSCLQACLQFHKCCRFD